MLNENQILSIIEDAERNSYGINDSELSGERSEALDYFYGRPFGNEVEGRSQVVSHDAKDTVMWVMPSLMKVFASGDEVVRFDPKSQNDEQTSEQETDYINHIVMEKNRGFELLYSWFFDALTAKTGYVKAYWENYTTTKKETYQGMADEEIAMLLQNKDVKVVGHSPYVDEMGMTYHDVEIEVECKEGKCCLENVAPEDMLIGYDVTGTSLRDAVFVQQRSIQSISQLREMGFDVDDNISSDTNSRYDENALARDNYGEGQEDWETGANRRVLVRETYIRLDMNDDGINELWRFVLVGNTILDQTEVEAIPYASICPVPMPHRHVGLSYVDLVKDLQLIKSTLLRNALDAQYQSIHGRFAINKDRVDMDDMLVSRTGGLVRVEGDPAGSIMPLVNPVDGTKNLGIIQYVDEIRQQRTGVTDSFQGMDANALNKTKGGTQMLMSAAQTRVELVARIFAETGVKDLFLLVHELVRKHANKAEITKLRNKWVPVDPRTWDTRTDMSVSVGLGTGNKDQMLQHLMMILQAQREAVQIGIASPKNIYNALVKLTQNAGFKDPDQFWTDPEGQQQQQQKGPSPEEMKIQADMQQAQAELQLDREKMQADIQLSREKMMAEIAMAKEKLAADIYSMNMKLAADIELKQKSMEAEMEINRNQNTVDLINHQVTTNSQHVDTRMGVE